MMKRMLKNALVTWCLVVSLGAGMPVGLAEEMGQRLAAASGTAPVSAAASVVPVVALSGPSAVGPSAPVSSIDGNISLDLRDMDISEALKFLALKASLNIIPTQKVAGRVTLMVNDVPTKDVFDLMIRSNNLAYDRRGDIYNVMTEDEYKSYFGKNFSDGRQVKVFHLRYAVPDQVFAILDSFKSTIGKIFVEPETGTVMVMDAPDRLNEIAQAVTALEQKTTIRIFDLKYAKAKDMEEQLKSQLDLKKVGSIKADERTNQIIVQTLPERMDDIERLILGLDHKTREVLIDARIIKINLKNDQSRGVEWEGLFKMAKGAGLTYLGSTPFSVVNPLTTAGTFTSRKLLYDFMQQRGDIGAYPFSGTSTSLNSSAPTVGSQSLHLGMIGRHDFDLLIKYLDTFGKTRILSCPQIAVINNQEAKIHVGARQAYVTTSTTTGANTNTVSENVTYVDVGLQMSVTPIINEDGYVTMKIKPEISNVVDTITSSSNNKIPIIDTAMAETSVMVKDGSTVMIGGLRQDQEVETSQGTPFFSRIPFVGFFFSEKTVTKIHSELLILLTPHIISGDELTTGYERDFGAKVDKSYQDYAPITQESDLSSAVVVPRAYQNYPDLKNNEEEYQLALKPVRES
jgi:type II secretory pathway component GspD/PulD (secretin)